jgi:tetratricopeptide (TPR) repeat protein
VVLGFSVQALHSQANRDSLWQVWNEETTADTNRLKAVQALIWSLMNVNLDSALQLSRLQLDLAKSKDNKKWIGKALYNIATHYYLKSDYAQSFTYYNQSLDIRKETHDLKGEAAIYSNLGLIFGNQGNELKGLEYQLKGLEINERLKDTAGLTTNYTNLAAIYQNQADSTKALEYYEKALAMYKAQHNDDHVGLIYNNLGNMYQEFGNFEKAQWYLRESLRLRTEVQDFLGMAINYLNLGTLHIMMGDLSVAKNDLAQSIVYYKKLKDDVSLANVYYNLGDIARREHRYTEAVRWCKSSLEIAESVNKISMEATACSCLYRSYKEMGNPVKALTYFEDYMVLTDSLQEDELRLELSRLEFEKEILTDSISRVKELNQLNDVHALEIRKRARVTNIISYAAIGLLLLLLIFLGRMLVLQRHSDALKRKTQELEKQQLVNEISLLKTQVNPHFLFNSLSILSSLVHVDADLSEKFIDQLSRSYRYILEQKDQALVTLRTELGFIESYAFLLKIRFENKFNLEVQIPDDALDKFKIAPLTLQLLIENAVKHNRMSLAEPLIVHISLEENSVLVVKNKLQPRTTEYRSTGIGLQNIMNRYALLTKRQVWAGERDDQFVVKIPLLNETTKNQL